MCDATIARNYADVLLSLARKGEDPHGWGRLARELADAVERDVKLRRFLACLLEITARGCVLRQKNFHLFLAIQTEEDRRDIGIGDPVHQQVGLKRV